MKKVLFFFVLVTISLNGYAQNDKSKAEVNQTLIQFFDGSAKLDMNKIQQYSTHDVMIQEDGIVWNMDSVRNVVNMFKGTTFFRTNTLDFIQTEVKGNTAWVAYHNTADMTINGQNMNLRWMESAVLVKEGNVWKVRLLHSTIQKPQGQ